MTALTLKELLKRNNIEVFLNKIKNNEPFELVNDKSESFGSKSVIIKNDDNLVLSLESYLDSQNIKDLNSIYFNKQLVLKTIDDRFITSGYLQKTIEFGSVSSQKTYQKEKLFYNKLQNNLSLISNNFTKPVNLIFYNHNNEKIYTAINILNVKETEKQKGNYVKSDFEFINLDNNSVLWFSHKDGNKSSSFRQWSGIKDFENHEEIKKFAVDLKRHNRHLIKKYNVGRKIKDSKLKKEAVFGLGDSFNHNCVQLVIQGEIQFSKIDEENYIVKANHIFSYDKDLSDMPKDYEPIIFASKLNLEPHRCSYDIQGCRGLIYPIKGKKVKLI